MITEIYRIKTRNSIYEIQVKDDGVSRCHKEGEAGYHQVRGDSSYLEKLCIGPAFDVPGVVKTSNVLDYVHFVLSSEPKRMAKALRGSETGIPEFFQGLAEHVIEQANGGPVMVEPRVYKGYGPGCSEYSHVGGCTCDLPPACKVEGCTYSSKYGPGHNGSRGCKSGSIASGGTRAHCSCDYCY